MDVLGYDQLLNLIWKDTKHFQSSFPENCVIRKQVDIICARKYVL